MESAEVRAAGKIVARERLKIEERIVIDCYG